MMVKNSTRNLVTICAFAFGVWTLSALFSCSSNSPTGGGGGGGGTKEFASGNLSGNGGSFSHVFATAKSVPYYCSIHGGPGGAGMSGVITVNAGGTPSRTNVSITSSSLPDLIIDVMDTVVWTNNSGTTHNVKSDN